VTETHRKAPAHPEVVKVASTALAGGRRRPALVPAKLVDQIEVEMLKDQSSDRAKREADKAFKPVKAPKPMNDYAKDQHSLNENRERLKAERLAREAQPKSPPE